MTKDQMLHL